MSTPQANESGYKAGNVLTYASNLSGPLLVMHGMADDNVLFTHSTTLFKKLQDLNKPFDMMTYPGSKHALLRFASTGPHGYETVVRFFEAHLKAKQQVQQSSAPAKGRGACGGFNDKIAGRD